MPEHLGPDRQSLCHTWLQRHQVTLTVPGNKAAMCRVLVALRHLLRSKGERSLHRLQSVLYGFSLLNEIITTVEISAVHKSATKGSQLQSFIIRAERVRLTTFAHHRYKGRGWQNLSLLVRNMCQLSCKVSSISIQNFLHTPRQTNIHYVPIKMTPLQIS